MLRDLCKRWLVMLILQGRRNSLASFEGTPIRCCRSWKKTVRDFPEGHTDVRLALIHCYTVIMGLPDLVGDVAPSDTREKRHQDIVPLLVTRLLGKPAE